MNEYTNDCMEIEDEEVQDIRENLLNRVAKSNGFFKSQQVGEKDLSFTEKRDIAANLLKENVSIFLQRYWKYMQLDDIPYFEPFRTDYDVDYYVTEIAKLHNSRTNHVKIRNRRYEAMKKMINEGSYFSDAEMKKRNPYLYDQMIGHHLTEDERVAAYREQFKDQKFSTFLMDQMQRNIENCLFEKQKHEDSNIVEEDQTSSEEESELEDETPVPKVTGEEKKMLRSEFTNIMYENFLAGKDKDFDYTSIDNNVEYDSVHQRDIDEEEKYFDDESSHSVD